MNKKSWTDGASFGKILLASAVAVIGVGILVSIIWLISLFSIVASTQKKTNLNPKSVLEIKLNYPIVEQQQDNFNFNYSFLGGFANIKSLGLNKILAAIKKAKTDDNIKGILIDASIPQCSLADIEEIRNAILNFKKSGKFVIAHADTYSPSAYYLATAANKIYITPTGLLVWKGLSAQVMYYKGLLKKLDIQPEIIRHGKFKSAVEPYMLDSMSQANRLQLKTLLKSLWNRYVWNIAKSRKLDIKALNNYADNLLINSSKAAVNLGLVDAEKYRNDVLDEIKSLIGTNINNKLHLVSLRKYIDANNNFQKIYTSNDKQDKIAIIYAEGEIILGKSTDGKMGSETIANAIRKAANKKNVKAIVLRVNSPGGSALASEIIWHEIDLAKKKKPIVVSMGRYAASGGYYISCDANKIFAEPYTITGSIGVFGIMFNIQKLLNNKLGINVNAVKTNKNSDFGTIYKPMNYTQKQYLTTQIEDIYKQFITHVAKGRKLRISYVDSIGQGRVWSADNALKIGLIDSIGYIHNAIEEAAKLANIKNYKIIEYPKVKNLFEKILENYQTSILQKKLGLFYEPYKQIQSLSYLQGIETYMPYNITIE
jgi:protease-4